MFASKDLFATQGGYRIPNSLRFRSSASAYLNRTPASAGNRKTWTWSGWVKRGALGSNQVIFACGSSYTTNTYFTFYFGSDNTLVTSTGTAEIWRTTAVYRDPSAFYHLVLVVDITNATANNRTRLWVNGSEVTNFTRGTNLSLNTDYGVNDTIIHYLGRDFSGVYIDDYLAEVNFIDGQALTPSSFGAFDTNGVWQPKAYTGTYGTNGFYLKFSDNSALTTSSNAGIGKDFSGNSNYWVTNNISITAGTTYDSMIDSPTNYADGGNGRGNYATLNPLDNPSAYFVNATFSAANLNIAATSGGQYYVHPTISNNTGKFYQEYTVTGLGAGGALTNSIVISAPGNPGAVYCAYDKSGQKYVSGSWTTGWTAWTANDVIGVAVDYDAGTAAFYLNGTLQGTLTFGSQGSAPLCTANNAQAGSGGTVSVSFNAGQRPFSISSVPSGYKALNTLNLPAPTILNGAQYMAAVTYTGNGGTQTVTTTSTNSGNNPNGTTFQPDWVWVKSRSAATDHALYDAVRGVQLQLESNTTTAETTETTGLTAFTSSGFTTGALAQMNTNTATYVAWEWNAGGSTVSGTGTGSITNVSYRTNPTAGFSVVIYTGSGANGTVTHGLGVAPSMIFIKMRTSAGYSWIVYHASVGNTAAPSLDTTGTPFTSSGYFNNTSPTSSVFTVGTSLNVNAGSNNYVAYCFAPVAGYSAFGSYTGNGSADGPFIYTDFRPRYLLIKRTDSTGDWSIIDTSRSTYNVTDNVLWANLSSADAAGQGTDILSNGFKLRSTGLITNASSGTFVYAAFAENPFKTSRAR